MTEPTRDQLETFEQRLREVLHLVGTSGFARVAREAGFGTAAADLAAEVQRILSDVHVAIADTDNASALRPATETEKS